MPDSQTSLPSGTQPADRDAGPTGWHRFESSDSLAGFLTVIRQRRRTLAATILLVPLGAYAVLSSITPQYTATGALIYQASEYQARELQSMVRQDPITEATMASQAEILQSLKIAQRVAERGNLFADAAFNASLRPPGLITRAAAAVHEFLGTEANPGDETPVFGPRRDRSRDATLVAVQAALHASTVRFSHVLEVTFTADDPFVAAAGVNNAMDIYIKGLYGDRKKKIDQATGYLQSQAAILRDAVQKNEEKIAAYREKTALSQGIHAGIDTEQISRLLEELAKARAEQAGADGKLDAARGQHGAAAQAAVAPSVVQIRVQQDRLAAQIQAGQGRLGSEHPETQGLTRQFAEGQRALAAETARVVASIEAEQRVSADRVASLEAAIKDAGQAADKANRQQIPLNAMTRDLEAARGQLQTVLDRIQQTAHQTEIESPEAHEISQAMPPDRPSSPRTAQSMAAAAAAGVFLGLMLVFLLDRADDTLSSGRAVRMTTGLPCFALVPEIGKRALGHLRVHEYAVRRPHTAFAEQVRSLRIALAMPADRPKIVAVTAARPDEGKTLTTLSLGRSAAVSGERVLTVECDVRRPSFERQPGGDLAPGLLDILRDGVAWRDAVQDDPVTGMHVILSGKPGGDVAGLFLSDRMRAFLAEVREQYDLVLLDAPPVEVATEARIAAALADATLLCVRFRSTRRGTIRHALEILNDTHAKVIGTIMTRVDPRAHLRTGSVDASIYHRRYRAYYRG